MKNIVAAFTGKSGSGKTTLIEKITKKLSKNYRVVVVKHDPKDKAVFDTEGKDSDKFTKAGADTVVVSPKKTTYLKRQTSTIDEIKEMVGSFDYLLIEGLRTLLVKRIGVFRKEVDRDYFSYVKAVAIDESVDKSTIPKNLDILDLNKEEDIIRWIDDNC